METGGFRRLKQDFSETYDWKNVTREEFREWARTIRKARVLHISDHELADLRAERPVREVVMEAFSEFISLGKSQAARWAVDHISDPCEPTEVGDDEPELDPWKKRSNGETDPGAWKRVFEFMTRNFTPREEAFCVTSEDFSTAARMVMEKVAQANDQFGKRETAIPLAESVMKISHVKYSGLLESAWSANRHSVMFAVRMERGVPKRVGVTVMMAITEGCYGEMVKGKEAHDLQAADLVKASRFVHMNALAENRELNGQREKKRRGAAMISTMLYQCAAMTPSPVGKDLHLVTFLGTPENERRLRMYNFVETGSLTSYTGRKVLTFSRPDIATLGRPEFLIKTAEYIGACSTISFYQDVISTLENL